MRTKHNKTSAKAALKTSVSSTTLKRGQRCFLFAFLGSIFSAAIIPNHSLFCFLFKERKLLKPKAFYALYLTAREGKHWGLPNIGEAYTMSRNSHILTKGKI